MFRVRRQRVGFGVGPVAALLVVAVASTRCGGEARNDAGNDAGAQNRSGGASSMGGATAMGGMTPIPTGGLPNGFGCPGIPSEWPAQTADVCGTFWECECLSQAHYFLIERSERMAEPWGDTTRWEFLKEAFGGYGRQSYGGVAFSGGFESSAGVCDPELYAEPAVAWTPNTKASESVLGALELAPPAGKNPMLLAFNELVAFLAASNPEIVSAPWTSIVLVTATSPDDCPSSATPDDLALAIADALRNLPRTDIVTIALDADYDVDVLAKAAGKLPFRIGANEPPSRLLEVFTPCGFPELQCEGLQVPPPPEGHGVDLDTVWIGTVTPRGMESPPRVAGPEACANSPNGGYYVDTLSDPPMIRLCPCSCPRFSYCEVGVQVGCPPL